MREPENIQEIAGLPINFMGFIFYRKSPRFVLEPTSDLSNIKKVGVFVDEELDTMIDICKNHHINIVQLHGNEQPDLLEGLKNKGFEVWKAFGVGENIDWKSLRTYSKVADKFVFDTKSKNYGGTGQTFDWKVLDNYALDTPYFLSGGISIDNIEAASLYGDERLYGLDLNSKFEISPALKDKKLLQEALKKINI